MATATPPTPGETIATPEQQPTPSAATEAPALHLVTGKTDTAPAVDPDDAVATEKTPTLPAREQLKGLVARVQALRTRHPMAEIALFFFLGFVYDVVTLGRIDDTLTMVQQAVYLGVLGGLLLLEHRFPEGTEPPKVLAKVWSFREDGVHFFLGSLLSSFMLFYFKSASGLMSFVFLVVLFGLLVANELPRFRAFGPVVRVALFSLCISSYFAYVLPVTLGFMGLGLVTLASVLGCVGIAGLVFAMRRWTTQDVELLKWRVAVPGVGVQGAMLLLYVLKVIPPIPLAVQYSGIYHDVKGLKTSYGREYHLLHERKWWQFWHRGEQTFLAREGDKAWYFFSVFAPKGFEKYKLRVRWYYDHPEKGWTEHGNGTLLTIASAGNEWGFRSNAYASNPKPGDWLAVLETEDGHEINRLSFEVEKDERTEPRQFKVDVSAPGQFKLRELEDLEEERAEKKAAEEKAKAEKAAAGKK